MLYVICLGKKCYEKQKKQYVTRPKICLNVIAPRLSKEKCLAQSKASTLIYLQ